jgi:hypothetical protein
VGGQVTVVGLFLVFDAIEFVRRGGLFVLFGVLQAELADGFAAIDDKAPGFRQAVGWRPIGEFEQLPDLLVVDQFPVQVGGFSASSLDHYFL